MTEISETPKEILEKKKSIIEFQQNILLKRRETLKVKNSYLLEK
jgi:hypothetical protein